MTFENCSCGTQTALGWGTVTVSLASACSVVLRGLSYHIVEWICACMKELTHSYTHIVCTHTHRGVNPYGSLLQILLGIYRAHPRCSVHVCWIKERMNADTHYGKFALKRTLSCIVASLPFNCSRKNIGLENQRLEFMFTFLTMSASLCLVGPLFSHLSNQLLEKILNADWTF